MSIIVLKKVPKIIAIFSFFLCLALLIFSVISSNFLPQTLFTQSAEDISLSAPFPVVAKQKKGAATLNLFGLIPISTANVAVSSPPQLIVGGSPFGIKLLAKGVMVVGISKVQTKNGSCCPAEEAGLCLGDVITAVNNTPISTNASLQSIVSKTKGESVTLLVEHKGSGKTVTLTPALSEEGVYRIGLWVRDSTAGLGTLTFCDPSTGVYGGLGHGVCDTDTGELVPMSSGEIVYATVKGTRKGVAGTPGELKGTLISNAPLGNLTVNCPWGVFGTLTKPLEGESLPLGYKQEVEEGEAVIYSSANGTPKSYSCKIEKINLSDKTTQNMVIKITDPNLIAQTGGIVQGMSGSPVVQKGKLVGAVTHVFVNDPTRGYAVFAETMWQTAKEITENKELKKAS